MSMPNDEQSPPERQGRTDWTGTIIGALLIPVFFLFVYLGKAELGFTVCIVLGMVMLAIKRRWKLRRHVWFWVTVAVILALHIPFLFSVRWPRTNVPTLAFSLPLGIADYLLISGAISLAEKVFSKGHFANEEDG
jgi:Na+-translocating ferredoxin:NAD+ oxidoreductase RnfA subunit